MSFIDFADEIKSPWVSQKQTQIGGRNPVPKMGGIKPEQSCASP
jgi:hypothetical protein